MPRRLLAAAVLLVSCQSAPPPPTAELEVAVAQPSPAASASADPVAAVVDMAKVHVSAPKAGTVTIAGDAGAIAGNGAAQVLIGVIHDLLGSYTLLHAGNTVVVGGAKVPLVAGGFDPISVGNAGGPVQSGDRVLFVPKTAADVACGPTTYAVVP